MDLLRAKKPSHLLQRLHYSLEWYCFGGKMIWNEVLEEGKGLDICFSFRLWALREPANFHSPYTLLHEIRFNLCPENFSVPITRPCAPSRNETERFVAQLAFIVIQSFIVVSALLSSSSSSSNSK